MPKPFKIKINKCNNRVIKDSNGDVEHVLAENKERSVLYDDIHNWLIKIPLEQYNKIKEAYSEWLKEDGLIPNIQNIAFEIYERIRGKVEAGEQFELDVNQEPTLNSAFNSFKTPTTQVSESIKRPSISLESGFSKEVGYRKGKEYSTQQRINLQEKVEKFNLKNGIFYFVPFIQKGQSNLFIAQEVVNRNKGGEQQTLFAQANDNNVQYTLKALDILNSPKSQDVWNKGIKAKWSLDKILSELQIPKDQKQIILDWAKENKPETIQDIITGILADLSYSVEINTAKSKIIGQDSTIGSDGFISINDSNFELIHGEWWNIKEERDVNKEEQELINDKLNNSKLSNTQYYSNLTVPGGTNYTENEIAVPNITPSIKGHAQFSTDNGIGWFRSDEKDFYVPSIIRNQSVKEVVAYKEAKEAIEGKIKTRRILEIQSDLFQKGRENSDLITGKNDYNVVERRDEDGIFYQVYNQMNAGKILKVFTNRKDAEEYVKNLEENSKNSKQNQFLQLLNKEGDWIPFFIKSIVQDTIKQTTLEVDPKDIENKIQELKSSGLLEIKC